jgi:hypothetical protein
MDKSFEWIKAAIQSSCTPFHLECCEVLIELFAAKYQPAGEEEYNILRDDVRNKRIYFSVDA